MPQSPILTQNIHVPDNWLVEVVKSVYDLDNIRLENVDNDVHRYVVLIITYNKQKKTSKK